MGLAIAFIFSLRAIVQAFPAVESSDNHGELALEPRNIGV